MFPTLLGGNRNVIEVGPNKLSNHWKPTLTQIVFHIHCQIVKLSCIIFLVDPIKNIFWPLIKVTLETCSINIGIYYF